MDNKPAKRTLKQSPTEVKWTLKRSPSLVQSQKKYYEKNKEEINANLVENRRQYNQSRIKEEMEKEKKMWQVCGCGLKYHKSRTSKHMETKIHMDYLMGNTTKEQ